MIKRKPCTMFFFCLQFTAVVDTSPSPQFASPCTRRRKRKKKKGLADHDHQNRQCYTHLHAEERGKEKKARPINIQCKVVIITSNEKRRSAEIPVRQTSKRKQNALLPNCSPSLPRSKQAAHEGKKTIDKGKVIQYQLI